MSIVYTNNLDMHSGGVPLVVHLGQYDSDFSLVFNLYSSVGALTIESGTTAEIRGTKSDGFGYSADATIDIANKKVTVAGSNQMTAAARQNIFELVLLKNNKVLSSANFILDVEHAALDADTIQDESVLKELNAIIEGAATATQAAQDAAAAADRAEEAADDLSGTVQQVATNTQDIADLKDDLSDLESDIFASDSSSESSAYPHKTIVEFFSDGEYYPLGTPYPPENNKITITPIESMNTYYAVFTESTDIFFDVSQDVGLIIVGQISNVTNISTGYNNSLIFTGSSPVRHRYADSSDYPTETNKLHINANDTIMMAISTPVDPSDVLIYYGQPQPIPTRTLLNDDIRLNDSQIQQVKQSLPDSGTLSDDVKTALLACFAKVAWIDEHGQDYYDALYDALYDTEPEPVDPTRVYHLSTPKTINTTADVINTGLYLGSDSTFTILLDITINVDDTNRRRLINGSSLNPNNENQSYGINVMSYIYSGTRRISADFNGTEISTAYDATSVRRIRYVGRYDSSTRMYETLLYVDDTKSIDTSQRITVLGTPTSPLTIGGRTVDNVVSGVVIGTVRAADVYSRVLSDTEVAEFLGVEGL